jgi:hypothetical protein
MAVTIGSAGVTFNDATVQTTAFSIEGSSSTETTDYKLGTYVLVKHSTFIALNAAATLYADSVEPFFGSRAVYVLADGGGGLLLSGTWRARGALFNTTVGGDDKTPGSPEYIILFQRVS